MSTNKAKAPKKAAALRVPNNGVDAVWDEVSAFSQQERTRLEKLARSIIQGVATSGERVPSIV